MIVKMLSKAVRRLVTLAFPLVTSVALAQMPPVGSCAAIVREALQAANTACTSTSRNEVCYGNIFGVATPADGITDMVFENVGDIVKLAQIQSLQLSPMNMEDNQWGVALMQLQANLPDSLPGQNVTFLVFGDVTLEDNTDTRVRLEVLTTTASNMRLGPNTTTAVVGSLPAGAPVIATGKATNSLGETWVRARYEEYRTRTGWILAELVDVDLEELPDVDIASLAYSPMQAFYFRTGIGQQQCVDAPASGVLVQTPDGAGKVTFNINGIDIAIGSTVLLTAPDSESVMCLALLEGDADLQSAGAGADVNPGERSCTPIAEDGTPGRPGLPEPFDAAEIGSIAAILESLPVKVTIPDPAPIRTPTPFPTTAPTQVPVEEEATEEPAPGGEVTPEPTNDPNQRFVNVTRQRNGMQLLLSATSGPDATSNYVWEESEMNQYGPTAEYYYSPGTSYTVTLTVCWPDSECITRVISGNIPACAVDTSMAAPFTLTFVGSSQQYRLFRRNESCGFDNVAELNSSNPVFSSTIRYNEVWEVRESGTTIQQFTGSGYPVSATVP